MLGPYAIDDPRERRLELGRRRAIRVVYLSCSIWRAASSTVSIEMPPPAFSAKWALWANRATAFRASPCSRLASAAIFSTTPCSTDRGRSALWTRILRILWRSTAS